MNDNPYQSPAPDGATTPLAASAAGYQSLQRRAQVMKVTLAIDVGAMGMLALLFLGFTVNYGHIPNPAVINLFVLSMLTFVVVRIVNLVLFLSYVRRANINAHALGAQGMQFSPIGSIGWWFVPLANLYQPFAIVKELLLSSEPNQPGFTWRDQASPAIVPTWWLLWLGSGPLNNLASYLSAALNEPMVELALQSIAFGMAAIAGVLLIKIVTAISDKQVAKASQRLLEIQAEAKPIHSEFSDSL